MLSNLLYHVEEFRIYHDDDGIARLRLIGWSHFRHEFAHVSNIDIEVVLVIPGTPESRLPIEQRDTGSPDIAALIGREANASRWRLDIDAANVSGHLRQARVEMKLTDGTIVAIDAGRHLVGDFDQPETRERERALVMGFEGLGNNCEFGLMQRRIGFNRMGLLRLAGSFSNAVLASAFRTSFSDFATEDDLNLWLRGTEWMATSHRYGFEIHTYRHCPQYSEAQMRRDQSVMLRFQVEVLLDTIAAGERVMLRRMAAGDDQEAMDELVQAVRAHGPAEFVWVTSATAAKPHGHVERRHDGSLVAYHGRLAPTRWPTEFDKNSWIVLLAAVREAIDSVHATRAAQLASTID